MDKKNLELYSDDELSQLFFEKSKEYRNLINTNKCSSEANMALLQIKQEQERRKKQNGKK